MKGRQGLHLVAALLGVMSAGYVGGANAAVFKCVDPAGKTTFSDRPCAAGEEEKRAASTSPSTPKKGKGEVQRRDGKRQGLGHYVDRAREVRPQVKP